jgi:hypothetical protein
MGGLTFLASGLPRQSSGFTVLCTFTPVPSSTVNVTVSPFATFPLIGPTSPSSRARLASNFPRTRGPTTIYAVEPSRTGGVYDGNSFHEAAGFVKLLWPRVRCFSWSVVAPSTQWGAWGRDVRLAWEGQASGVSVPVSPAFSSRFPVFFVCLGSRGFGGSSLRVNMRSMIS